MRPPGAGPGVGVGPLDDAPWPEKLKARVTTPGADPAVHGYSVEGDLARHYSLAEGVLLALTGELPAAEQAAAFEVALHFLSPAPVNEAPAHATVVARICDVTTSAMAGTATIALAEQAHAVVRAHAGLLAELEAGIGTGAREWAAADDVERASVARLRAALRERGVVLRASTRTWAARRRSSRRYGSRASPAQSRSRRRSRWRGCPRRSPRRSRRPPTATATTRCCSPP
jgi:hypothetical protein